MLSGKYVKPTSSSGVFQMCELEVGMSLVKVMTNGEGRVSTVSSGRESLVTWGANMPSMLGDY